MNNLILGMLLDLIDSRRSRFIKALNCQRGYFSLETSAICHLVISQWWVCEPLFLQPVSGTYPALCLLKIGCCGWIFGGIGPQGVQSINYTSRKISSTLLTSSPLCFFKITPHPTYPHNSPSKKKKKDNSVYDVIWKDWCSKYRLVSKCQGYSGSVHFFPYC